MDFPTLIKAKVASWLDFILPRSNEEKLIDSFDTADFEMKARGARHEQADISAIFDYQDKLVKKLIWLLKFKGDKKKAVFMAKILHDHLIEIINDKMVFENFTDPVIIPIPMTKTRKTKRGFDQCELIARELQNINQNYNFTVSFDAVEKIKDTIPQTKLNNIERATNIKNCFAVKNISAVSGKNIIIIDDVFTTGSTIREVKSVLESAGAKKVIGFTFAH